MVVEANRWYHVRLRVTREKIVTWVDREIMIDIEREEHQFNVPEGLGPLAPLSLLSCGYTTSAVRNVRLRRLEPEADPRGAAPKAG